MVEYYINKLDVISEFLRVYLTDPRARTEATDSNTFSATSGQTEFTISKTGSTIQCITSVTVEGVSKTKWKDYYWDYQNSKITFFTGLTQDDEVIVNFKYGSTNWIYADKPDQDLSASSFPRIEVFTISSPGEKIGNYQAPVHTLANIQIDVWVRNGYKATIGGRTYSNEYLTRYLADQVLFAFEDHEEDLHSVFFDYTINGPRDAPYSEEFVSHHNIVDLRVQGINIGRIVT